MEDQNPLQTAIAKELNESAWLHQFQSLSHLLQTLKAEVPLTQQCDLKWVTDASTLLIHCPTPNIHQALQQQSVAILTINRQVNDFATQIILKHENNRVVLNPF